MFHSIRLASETADQEPCWVPGITGRSKHAQHMGGDVKTSINALPLPNVVNNNACAERQTGQAERRRWAALPGCWLVLGGLQRAGENFSVKYPGAWLSTGGTFS